MRGEQVFEFRRSPQRGGKPEKKEIVEKEGTPVRRGKKGGGAR